MFTRKIKIEETEYLLWSIGDYEISLNNIIPAWDTTSKEYCLRKNIAYNLQYLQYLKQNIEWWPFSTWAWSIHTLNIKHYIIISSSIIEALLFYLLYNNKTLNSDEINDIKYKKIITKCQSNHILWNTKDANWENIYDKLQIIRELRNKIHLHIWDSNNDHDYNSFWMQKYQESKRIIKYIFLIICKWINSRISKDDEFLKIFDINSN